MIKLKQILNEIEEEKKKGPYIQKPKAREPQTSKELPGYQITGKEEDPITGTSTTYLSPEPKLIRFAREVARIKKELKYFLYLSDEDFSMDLKQEVASIFTSLKNAEGKIRDLDNKINAMKNMGKND